MAFMPFSAMAAIASKKLAVTFSGSRYQTPYSIHRRIALAWSERARHVLAHFRAVIKPPGVLDARSPRHDVIETAQPAVVGIDA